MKELENVKEELKKLDEAALLAEKYSKSLVGACLHHSLNCYYKVIRVTSVDMFADLGPMIRFRCIVLHGGSLLSIYYNLPESIYIKDIEEKTISNEEFDKIFDIYVDFAKERIQKANPRPIQTIDAVKSPFDYQLEKKK